MTEPVTGAAPAAPRSHVVAALPPGYPRQTGLTCPEANARSVIAAFGLSYAPPPPTWTVRRVGYSLLRDLSRLLRHAGLDAPVRMARRMTDAQRLDLLRAHLDRGEPVILAVGNGHLSRDRDSALARALLGHYLTLYGYDDARGVFYVYDSYLPGEPPEPLPAGNDARGYADLLRSWRGPVYYPLIGRFHAYLPVSCPAD